MKSPTTWPEIFTGALDGFCVAPDPLPPRRRVS